MQTKEGPDDLTPREREVFGLLRLGLTNEEIAARLGISLDGAKYHVSQILSKLGVATREEAAAVPVEARRRWWVMLPLAAKAAGAAVVLAAVGGLGVLAWGVLNTSDGTEAGDSGGPRIGDHWHAPIRITVCGEELRDVSVPENGIRTQGDSILHIQPAQPFEEGAGASLVKWFEYGGGRLTETEINIPGSDKTFRNGDLCPDGEPGELQVFVTRAGESGEQRLGDFLQVYIPHDGDRIRIVFAPVDGPRIGDHWHAPYQFFACGEKQPNAGAWESGVNTPGDGILHIQPAQPSEEGPGASLVKWFEYGGGLLTETEINIPGSDKTFRNGDACPNGEPGELQVFVTHVEESAEERLAGNDLQAYIPHDGDRIVIVFGPENSPIIHPDRTVIPPDQATRTVEISVTDDGTDASPLFEPARIEVQAGETVKIVVRNQGTLSHVIRVAGDDGNYVSSDDFVSVPEIIPPGDEGYAVVRLDTPGEVPFRDDTLGGVSGVIVVRSP
jgi:DNA-binding CsgD family transcriptional regulator/plastocyanin